MSRSPTIAHAPTQLIGRTPLIEEILRGVEGPRRLFALEGITGVGKTAVLSAVMVELNRRGYCPAVLNAVEQASEDLAVAMIYAQLKSLPQDPEATIEELQKRITSNLPKALRSVTAAVMADLAKLATDKAGKTIDALQKIVAGDTPTTPVGEALDQLEASNKRLFLSQFLGALEGAGTKVAIVIDNVDQANLTDFLRFLIAASPESMVLLLAHNMERGDNLKWDNVASDIKAKSGMQLLVAPLGRSDVAEWFHRDIGRWPSNTELERLERATGGRPHDLELALIAFRDGVDPATGDYSGYYEARRRAITGDARTIAELLAIMPYDARVGADALELAAAHVGVADVGPALDRLGQDRLLRDAASGVALAHALVQDTWRLGLTQARRAKLVDGWYAAWGHFQGDQLTSPDATAILPVIVTPLLEARPPAEVAEIGNRLLRAGQVEVGLQLVDRGWKFEALAGRGGEDVVQQALLAAKTRLEMGRYSEVDEPLAQAERSTDTEARIEALLLRMKLALRRNAYDLLWLLAEQLDVITDSPRHRASAQATLNVAYRDIMDLEGVRVSTERLMKLRDQLPPEQRMSLDRSIARALAKLNDLDAALDVAERAINGASDFGTARDLGNSFLARGEVRRYRREYFEALNDYRMAEQFGRGMGNRDSQLWSLLGAAAAHIESGNAPAAQAPLSQVSALLSEPGYSHPIESAHLHLLRALAGEALDDATVMRPYEELGIDWPRSILARFREGAASTETTPL